MKLACTTLSAIALSAAPAFSQTFGFDGGSNDGFIGNAFFVPTLGNPGGNAHHLVNSFFITLRTGGVGEPVNPAFLGDYSGTGPVTFSFDVKVDSLVNVNGPITRPVGIMLIDRDIQGPNGASGVFFGLGGLSSAGQPDWTELSVTIDDPTSTTLPPGWVGFGAEDPVTLAPELPAGATFATVLSSVDEFRITGAVPGFFFGFADFDLRIDNVSVTRCAAGSATYCTSTLNSSGSAATIGDVGVPSVGANAYALTVSGAAPNRPGIFFYGDQQASTPFGDGLRCVGGALNRLSPPLFTSAQGDAQRPLDLSGPSDFAPGSSWNFQFWFRDPGGPGGSGFNLSDGLAVTFCN